MGALMITILLFWGSLLQIWYTIPPKSLCQISLIVHKPLLLALPPPLNSLYKTAMEPLHDPRRQTLNPQALSAPRVFKQAASFSPGPTRFPPRRCAVVCRVPLGGFL